MLIFTALFTLSDGASGKRSDPDTVGRMYRQYADMIYRIAFVRTLSEADAEDILQEVFCRYIRFAPQFSDTEHCRAWFIRTAINCSKTLLTSAWRRHIAPDEEVPDSTVLLMEQRSEVYHAVMQLPAGQRTVVHLYYYEDQPIASIARLTGLSQSAVKSRLRRAREALRRLLGEEETDRVQD